MVKHCCFGTCNSDSRYMNREHMKNVDFIAFPKPPNKLTKAKNPALAKKQLEKFLKWIHACGRTNEFNLKSITKQTYICTKHFVSKSGPTQEDPDPIIATKVILTLIFYCSNTYF